MDRNVATFDDDLAFMLRAEHVAIYEDGVVRILDRRIYPIRVEYVTCHSPMEVRQALQAMVTQSAGPYTACAMGMALAAHEARNMDREQALEHLERSGELMATARPTTQVRMEQVVAGALKVARETEDFTDLDLILRDHALRAMESRYASIERVAEHLLPLLPDQGTVMTQCFGETIIGMMGRLLRGSGKEVSFVCPETRPYLQGARFTASVLKDMGYPVTVITDNMVAAYMEQRGVDLFTSAADSIAMDGGVINKVGTHQIAILAKYFHIPYFVTGIPDLTTPRAAEVPIEQRNPEEAISAHGIKHVLEGVEGWYPAFDHTPAHLVSGVVTDLGVFSPYDLEQYRSRKSERGSDFYSFAV
ncbi:MAG: s-methyl-5-thioribose-1-phosphate isomerase [Tissierellia bacterium]|nr:s-methyl-5-thioribose-1-phosphate isomerase [Tissierellia bacterium]